MVRSIRTRGSQRGSATLEFALVLPLVLILTLAVVQVGLLVKDQLIVVEAARAGARQAAVSEDDAQARAAAEQAAVSLRRDRLDVAVARDGGGGTPVRVDVRYRAPIVVPLVRWLFPSEVALASSATMRQEVG